MSLEVLTFINNFQSSLYRYFIVVDFTFMASLVAQTVKNPPAMQKTWFDPWDGEIPWRKA